MLSQLQKLSYETDGRYATDEELEFVSEFGQLFYLRVQTYQRLQAMESIIVQQVLTKIQLFEPSLFHSNNEALTAKWKRDTLRVLRYSAIAMLLNDPDSLRDRLLFWFRTIMKAFDAQRSCNVTYAIMQDVVKHHLTAPQASLFCPILEMNRQVLGAV
ncbi:phycobilisome protein [Phormidium sp. CLA17]|uniref:phycobilisome protein n=1 Tax=Leptolyngbya sp. Cla-17 TaxID=2803751 RepID=UPI0014925402|nr:phycobilisome protein [Leptolyngbya sp. Cla-17]MBM0741092.1 phycobilisome protein [Leptolyngbya sp. Cla-17]